MCKKVATAAAVILVLAAVAGFLYFTWTLDSLLFGVIVVGCVVIFPFLLSGAGAAAESERNFFDHWDD